MYRSASKPAVHSNRQTSRAIANFKVGYCTTNRLQGENGRTLSTKECTFFSTVDVSTITTIVFRVQLVVLLTSTLEHHTKNSCIRISSVVKECLRWMVFHCPSEEVEAAPVAMDVTPTQRMLSACAGVLTTSLVVTPMGEHSSKNSKH